MDTLIFTGFAVAVLNEITARPESVAWFIECAARSAFAFWRVQADRRGLSAGRKRSTSRIRIVPRGQARSRRGKRGN